MSPSVSDNLRQYLETGARARGDAECFWLAGHTDLLLAAWRKHRDEIMPEWVKQHPCRRPWAWWEVESPEPRQRVGGRGKTTPEEFPAVVKYFNRGLPESWHEIDRADPPVFESEASYLDRHGLLTAIEKTYLAKHPELLTPERIDE